MDLFKLLLTVRITSNSCFLCADYSVKGESLQSSADPIFYLRKIGLILFFNTWKLNLAVASNTSLISKVVCCCCRQVASVMSDPVGPHRRQPTRLPHPWDSPGKNTAVGCHFLLQSMKVKSESEVAQSCLTLSEPVDCSLPGSSVHGIFQARVLEWGAIALSE